jgi:hypothetical protein
MTAQIVSKTGAPVIELGTWVQSTGNTAYIALMEQFRDALVRGEPINSAEFNAMATDFLASTNQDVIGGPIA